MIHIEGMGWQGSIFALHLAERSIPFTWHDIDSPIRAWSASTGLCYPSGTKTLRRGEEPRSPGDLRIWHGWAAGRGPAFPAGAVDLIDFTHTCARPPHDGPKSRAFGDGWQISSVPGVRVDVPAVVRHVRDRFGGQRLDSAPTRRTGDLLVRSHGFTERIHRWVWGWNRPVQLRLPAELVAAQAFERTSIYCRYRYAMAYAYPLCREPGWYLAGSALMPQHTAHRLTKAQEDTQWELWTKRVRRMAPFVEIDGWGEMVQGWRPQGRPEDSGYPVRRGDVITFPPLWHSGVRWSPSTVAAALRLL